MRSSNSFSLAPEFVVLNSAAEARARFPTAKIIAPIQLSDLTDAQAAAVSAASANQRTVATNNLLFPAQSAGNGFRWYSPYVEFPPDCNISSQSCSSSSLSSTCEAPCVTTNAWYWQDIDPGNEYEPDTEYTIEPAQLPSKICPGDYITLNITPSSIAGYGEYGIDISFSWSGTTPGQQSCFSLVSYSPGLQYNGSLTYPPPTALDLGWQIYWGISGGIYDPPYPKVTTYSVTVQYTGNCCNTNYNQTIGSFVLYGGDRDRYRVADVICCEEVGSIISVPYTVPGWKSFATDCPPEGCISIGGGGGGWKSPFFDSAPSCDSGSASCDGSAIFGPNGWDCV